MNPKRCEANERSKRAYLEHRKYAGRLCEKSLDKEMAAIERFDVWNGRKDLRKFQIEQAKGFRDYLEHGVNPTTKKPFSASTVQGILGPLRTFFVWLSGRDGYRRAVRPSDADYFNISRRDAAIARASEPRPAPTPEQARRALETMPSGSTIELRDRAILALLILTAVRDGALITLRLKHVDLVDKCLWQNAKQVSTKFNKSIRTYFLTGYPEADAALEDWVTHQRETLLRGADDPLFPQNRMCSKGTGGFRTIGVTRSPWRSTQPVRQIIANAFEAAGIQPFGPHSFRHMHARETLQSGATVEQLWAVSQNIGHSSMLTTIGSYGQLPDHRRRELIRGEKK